MKSKELQPLSELVDLKSEALNIDELMAIVGGADEKEEIQATCNTGAVKICRSGA